MVRSQGAQKLHSWLRSCLDCESHSRSKPGPLESPMFLFVVWWGPVTATLHLFGMQYLSGESPLTAFLDPERVLWPRRSQPSDLVYTPSRKQKRGEGKCLAQGHLGSKWRGRDADGGFQARMGFAFRIHELEPSPPQYTCFLESLREYLVAWGGPVEGQGLGLPRIAWLLCRGGGWGWGGSGHDKLVSTSLGKNDE